MQEKEKDASLRNKLAEKFEFEELTSLPENLAGLEKILTELEHKLKAIENYIKDLMNSENPADGIFFAQEIHEAKQLKMMFKYQRDLCAARVKNYNCR